MQIFFFTELCQINNICKAYLLQMICHGVKIHELWNFHKRYNFHGKAVWETKFCTARFILLKPDSNYQTKPGFQRMMRMYMHTTEEH